MGYFKIILKFYMYWLNYKSIVWSRHGESWFQERASCQETKWKKFDFEPKSQMQNRKVEYPWVTEYTVNYTNDMPQQFPQEITPGVIICSDEALT